MKSPLSNLRPRTRLVLGASLVLLWFVVEHRVSDMDDRFFHGSVLGAKALVLYEVGDSAGAAKAYREDLRDRYRTERTAEDPIWDALLRGDYQEAGELSTHVLEKNPSDVGALLTLDEIALEEGAFSESISLSNRVFAIEKDQYDARLLASVAYARAGRYGDAIDSMNRALRTGKVETRITSFVQVLKTMGELKKLPRETRPVCLLAHYHRYLRIFDSMNAFKAIGYAREAVEKGDHPDDAYLTMGVIYYREGKAEKALDALRKGVEANPKNPEVLRWASLAYSNRGDLANEYRMTKAAYEAAPEDPFYVHGYMNYLTEKLGDYHQALAVAQARLEMHPDDPDQLHWSAYLYSSLGEEEEAVKAYRKALLLSPRKAELHEGLGDSLIELGRIEEAAAEYRAAILIEPYRPGPYTGLAHVYEMTRNYDEAIKEYKQALLYGPDNVEEQMNLCGLLHRVSQYESAAACMRSVLSKDPDNKRAQHMLPYTLQNVRRMGAKQ